MADFLPLLMFAALFAALLFGYSVAATLAGISLLFAGVGAMFGVFDLNILGFLPGRLFGTMTNQTLVAVPLFILMGVTLERTRIAEALLQSMSELAGKLRGGLGLAVIIVGMLMAASTGIVGATVVTMGLLSLPVMLKQGYDRGLATGTIAATGTLGQIIPPSIALVLLGDVLGNAYQQAQISQGVFSPKTVSVGDLFAGSLLPGLCLVALYATYVLLRGWINPEVAPGIDNASRRIHLGPLLKGLLPPIVLIVVVLGSIVAGYATPTEAAGVGAGGAFVMAIAYRALSLPIIREIIQSTLKTTSMVFFILIGASFFSLVFRGYGGDELIQEIFAVLPGGVAGAVLIVMIVIFLLGFVLDFVEITYVVVPIVGPLLLAMGVDPVWLGVLLAINLQTSFLTPPFGFALFYLRGVTPPEVQTIEMYKGVVPFILLQLILMGALVLLPEMATWLPSAL